MPVPVDPGALSGYADDLRNATHKLISTAPPTQADAGQSSAALAAAVAELLRTSAGLAEITLRAADDLASNKTVYATATGSSTGADSAIEAD